MSLKISTWLLCSLVSLLAFQASAQTGKGMVIFADAVYHNGKVLTVDERFSIAQALAVRDGKVMAVGSNAEIINACRSQDGPARSQRQIDSSPASSIPIPICSTMRRPIGLTISKFSSPNSNSTGKLRCR